MDYKEKYEQALRKASDLYGDYDNVSTLIDVKEELENIFPELKESKEEKTKRILHSISSKMSFHLRDIFTEEEFQCFDAWSNAWLKGQGEQKPDKVEPKFHEGDWLIYENGSIYYVNKVYEHTYELVIDNGDKPRTPHELIDKKARIWTIQDAKEGDMLVTEDWVFIFKKMNNGKPVCYCHYDIELGFRIDTNSYIASGSEIYPATKEQRDLLFQKMKEAGYYWDADKKELKKIEQMSAAWSEKDEIRWNNVILMVEAAFVGEEEKKYAEWLKSLKGRFVPQTKREWSHEDEKMLRDIDTCIAKLPVFYSKIEINGEEKTCSDFIINARHWLKSLRS